MRPARDYTFRPSYIRRNTRRKLRSLGPRRGSMWIPGKTIVTHDELLSVKAAWNMRKAQQVIYTSVFFILVGGGAALHLCYNCGVFK